MIEDGEREEIEKLLPWYVTGRLGLSDTSKVERYLRQHPEALSQLQFIGRERQETIRANEAMGWRPSSLSHRLMSSLPGSARPATAPRLRLTLGQFLQISPAFGARFAALAVVVLILAEAA